MKNLLRLVVPLAVMTLSTGVRADFHDHLGLQLYSLRATTMSKGLTATLDLAKSYGIKEVETGGATPGMTVEQIRKELDARGLKAASMHVSYEALTKDVAVLIADAKTLGVSYAFCPWIPHKAPFDAAAARKAAEDFNRWGAAFRAAGLTFGYHVHGYEFAAGSKPGETLLDDIIRGTNPENVAFEMDVFWVVHGGGDPVKLLQKYPKRWLALHVKDLRKGVATGNPTGKATAEDEAVVGAGQVDWKAVIGAAEKSGAKYYFVEDETAEPLKNIPASLEYLRKLKL